LRDRSTNKWGKKRKEWQDSLLKQTHGQSCFLVSRERMIKMFEKCVSSKKAVPKNEMTAPSIDKTPIPCKLYICCSALRCSNQADHFSV
jgi:hypothetical protein